jgi:hypothetical protein
MYKEKEREIPYIRKRRERGSETIQREREEKVERENERREEERARSERRTTREEERENGETYGGGMKGEREIRVDRRTDGQRKQKVKINKENVEKETGQKI